MHLGIQFLSECNHHCLQDGWSSNPSQTVDRWGNGFCDESRTGGREDGTCSSNIVWGTQKDRCLTLITLLHGSVKHLSNRQTTLTDRENTSKHVEEEMDQKPVSVITKEGHSGDFQHLFGNNTSRWTNEILLPFHTVENVAFSDMSNKVTTSLTCLPIFQTTFGIHNHRRGLLSGMKLL